MATVTAPRLDSLMAQVMPSAAEIAAGRRQLHRKAVGIAALAAVSYWGLVFAPVLLVVRMVFALALVIACVAIATNIMHDANHGTFVRSTRLNHVFGYSSDLLGGSSFLWRFKHNKLHHGNTNVVGFDTDIDQAPFARLAPQQQWLPRHRYQHLYMWFLYGFLTIQWLLLTDITTIVRGGVNQHQLPKRLRVRDVFMIMLGKVLHVGWAIVVPMLLFPWWGVLAFYVVCSWLVGFLLANIFQLAHCVDRAQFFDPDVDRRGAAFELHQLRTTVDIHSPHAPVRAFLHWLMGGLDYQVEHHLAPKLPHTLYPVVAPRLEAVCAERGIEYRAHPSLTAAVRSHARWLREMGREPLDRPAA